MAKLMIGMGLPGAGKSTMLRAFAEKYGHEYISVDEVRTKNGLHSGQPSTEKEWDEIRSRMLESYHSDKTVLVEGAFLGDIRKKFIDFARENGVEKIQGVLVDTPPELAWERAQSRGTAYPREVFENRLHNLEQFPPELLDGFDALFTLNEVGELKEAQMPREGNREHVRERKFI